MPENSTADTKVFKASTLMDDDPVAQALTQLGMHMGEQIHTAMTAQTRERSDSDVSMEASIKKDARKYSYKVAAAALGLASAIATGFYQYGGPAEQTAKADAAVEHVDEKMVQLDATTKELETLKADIEKKRQERVTGRLSGVEQRTAVVEGQVAGLRVGQDALLDAALTEDDAREAKAQASVKAAATETSAKQKMAIDAMAE